MKVVLLENVSGLGRMDEVKDVSEGYARNFLFPRHLAVQASPRSLSTLSQRKNKQARFEEAELRQQQSLAERLDGMELEFKEKANDQGLLYAQLGAQKIIEHLNSLGVKIKKNQVIFHMPIKVVGEHAAKIRFDHGLEAEIKLIVTSF